MRGLSFHHSSMSILMCGCEHSKLKKTKASGASSVHDLTPRSRCQWPFASRGLRFYSVNLHVSELVYRAPVVVRSSVVTRADSFLLLSCHPPHAQMHRGTPLQSSSVGQEAQELGVLRSSSRRLASQWLA